jgi:hypothetical protein
VAITEEGLVSVVAHKSRSRQTSPYSHVSRPSVKDPRKPPSEKRNRQN